MEDQPCVSSGSSSSESPECPESICRVCHSTENVRAHYGSFACHGCKAFFRRSIYDQRTYVCTKSNNCATTNAARNSCRACRLQRCLQSGMNPAFVREERGKNKIKQQQAKESEKSPNTSVEEEVQLPVSIANECPLTHFLCVLERKTEMLTDADAMNSTIFWRNDVKIADALCSNGIKMATSRFPLNWSCERLMGPEDMFISFHRNGLFLADWAVCLPDFRRLTQEDQVHFFKKNAMVFGWLTFCYKCYEEQMHEIGMPSGTGAYAPIRPDEVEIVDKKYVQLFSKLAKMLIKLVVEPMRRIQLTYEEFCLLKAFVLFQKNGSESPEGAIQGDLNAQKLLNTLISHINNRFVHLTPAQRMQRLSQIMLLLPALERCGLMEAKLLKKLPPEESAQLDGLPNEITDGILEIGDDPNAFL